MSAPILVISTSLSSDSNSRKLAERAAKILGECDYVDLRDYPMPLCGSDTSFGDPNAKTIGAMIAAARCVLVAVPIYNYDVSAAAKNVIELTGKSWQNKIVGFMCAAGGKSSYMSVMAVANSLMLDFRCLVIPRFVYADGTSFDDFSITDAEVEKRLNGLLDDARKLTSALATVSL
ncbi:MAG: NAD(P)H-dependent oxidoreductase [Candidatus Obscuribacterales bacterium]|nr:NAD(P)H-dependent oxidoreductase [Candidatus Obscuribacterales bacterium]